jgi:Flp pilus assembly protein TadD
MAAAPDPAELFRRGFVEHRSGRLEAAEAAYRQVLAVAPAHAEALHLLGVIAYRKGRSDLAIGYYERAIVANRDDPSYHSDLGVALCTLGRMAEAEAPYREALRLRPDYPEAHNNLGNALSALGRLAEAEGSYREALRLRPDYAAAHNNLGSALYALGRPEAAAASYRAAIRLQPDYAEAHNNLGNALCALGRPAEAEVRHREALRLRPDYAAAYSDLSRTLYELGRRAEAEASSRQALRLRPHYVEAYHNLGNALRDLDRPDEAEASYREALRLRPALPETRNNLGNLMCDLGRLAEAEACYREAIRLRPEFVDAHIGQGVVLRCMGRLAEAAASYRAAIRLQPDNPEPYNNLAYALLAAGRYEEGWQEYEWRWKTRHLSGGVRDFPVAQWGGEALGGRVILAHAEQGFGDTLQFCRYVPLIGGGRVVLEVQPPLARLLSGLPNIAAIVARGDRLPPFDLHCPLLSLPRAFGTTLASIPAGVPYLAADAARAASWRGRLAGLGGLRVGLVWAGGRRANVRPEVVAADHRRSVALRAMGPLGDIPGVHLFSLQKGEPAAQFTDRPPGMTLHDFTAELDDFADTAALVEALDLVISVDTAVAHLAGALGKPVWLLNRFDSDWRWLLDRDDSPWYPTLRQFRQPAPGDWRSVIACVHDALRRLAAGDRDQLRPRHGRG